MIVMDSRDPQRKKGTFGQPLVSENKTKWSLTG